MAEYSTPSQICDVAMRNGVHADVCAERARIRMLFFDERSSKAEIQQIISLMPLETVKAISNICCNLLVSVDFMDNPPLVQRIKKSQETLRQLCNKTTTCTIKRRSIWSEYALIKELIRLVLTDNFENEGG